ncbi:MAG: aminotransferase class I/II-fold pyridoxal phosphate-dependent enzyme [Proteobacteria bacterium]|nr:aminotransferase class I/II-fold pyridoxal phosphate-dependent enzyme [Pseudomonadota bacterium]
MNIVPFKIEEYFTQYEFSVRYMMGSSDPESFTLSELVAMADPESLALWNQLPLGYTEYYGLPLLRAEISQLYSDLDQNHILVYSGAEEAIYITMQVLLKPNDHVVVVTPCYNSLKEVAKAVGARVTEMPLNCQNECWSLDLEKFSSLVTDQTKLIIINFPHNPTGFLPDLKTFQSIIEIARRHNTYLFSDEVFRLSERNPQDRLPNAVDYYEKALSLGVMSKSFGLPGLRIGWVASHMQNLLRDFGSYKNYTSMCNSAPSEILALIALRNKEQILKRVQGITQHNLDLLDKYFHRYPEVYQWERPRAGFVGFPKLKLKINIETFAKKFIEAENVLIVPDTMFDYSDNRFRIGYGRRYFVETLAKLERFTKRFL